MSSTSLPIVPVISCSGCGVCCTYVGLPPGYGKFYFENMPELTEADWASVDGLRWRSMPSELRDGLIAYDRAVTAGTAIDRSVEIVPCLWHDAATGGCGNYEWRPQICRDFLTGGSSCLAMRRGEMID